MTIFVITCGGLLLLSALFFLFPRKPRRDVADEDLAKVNLESYRLREAELEAEGADALREDARLRLLEDEQQGSAVPEASPRAGRPFPRWVLLPVVAVLSTALYYSLGAAPDVMITQQLRSIDAESSPEQMRQLMADIETRAAQRPENLHYIALLGRYYMAQQDYARASLTYGALAEDSPEDAQALAYAAQAQYMASGRVLSDDARMNAEKALAINPHQRTALGLLGMASFEQGQYRAAVEYWERLLVMEPEGSESARMIAGVIASARQKLGAGDATAEAHAAPVPPGQAARVETAAADAAAADAAAVGAGASGSAGVTVRVALPEGGQVSPSDTVFVLARSAESESRMPIAVRRLNAGQLPITLRLDDSNSMAGQKLSDTDSVLVLVQVSPEGRPGVASATWLGQAGPLAPSLDGETLDIVLTPKS